MNLRLMLLMAAAVVRCGLWSADLPGQQRTYPVSFRSDGWWGGASEDLQLPQRTDRPITLRLRLGNDPVGCASVLVGVEEKGAFAPVVTLNGIASVGDAAEVMKVRPTGVSHKGVDFTCRRYWFPDGAAHGGADNVVLIGKTAEPKTVQWCELQLEPRDYAVGADVSWMTEMERNGAVFKTAEGTPRDCLQLMRDYGLNAVRLRVWVDPKGGWCGKADTLVKARRARNAGLDLMVDFHYSDGWADPGVQRLPRAWTNNDVEAVCSDVARHTHDVLAALKAEGLTPKWVQVGNETTFGMFWTAKTNELGKARWVDHGGARGWEIDLDTSVASIFDRPENYARVFKAGYAAAKDVFPETQVVVHLSDGEKFAFTERNLDTLRKFGAKWDLVGLSVYPPSDPALARSRIEAVAENIRKGARRWKTPYMVVETGVDVAADEAASVENARQILANLARAVREETDGACRGLLFWEPECLPSMYGKGAFTSDSRPTSVMTSLRR